MYFISRMVKLTANKPELLERVQEFWRTPNLEKNILLVNDAQNMSIDFFQSFSDFVMNGTL